MNHTLRRGYIVLMSVIIVGAIGLVLMVSTVYYSTISAKTNFSLQQASQARMLSNTCAEEALQKIADTKTSSSTGSLTLASGTCSYTISMETGAVTVKSTGISGTTTKRVKIVVASMSPSVVLSSWQEVSGF
jgi:hypothetical protein